MQKRGQGLSLNTVVIAAIVILVLIVLILIFTGRMGIFSGELKSCASLGGYCAADCPPETHFSKKGTDCDDTGQVCCMPRDDVNGDFCEKRGGQCNSDCGAIGMRNVGREDCPYGSLCCVPAPGDQCESYTNENGQCTLISECSGGGKLDYGKMDCPDGYVCCVVEPGWKCKNVAGGECKESCGDNEEALGGASPNSDCEEGLVCCVLTTS